MDHTQRPSEVMLGYDDDDEDMMLAMIEEDQQNILGVDEFLKSNSNNREPTPIVNNAMEIDGMEGTGNTPAMKTAAITTATTLAAVASASTAGTVEQNDDDDSPLFSVFNENVQNGLNVNPENHRFSMEAGGLVTIQNRLAERPTRTIATPTPLRPKTPKVDYTKPPATGRYLTSTCAFTDKTLYFPRINPKSTTTTKKDKGKGILRHVDRRMELLDKPIWRMKKEIEEQNTRVRKREEDEKLGYESYQDGKKQKRRKRTQVVKPYVTEQLWVDKYRPKGFLDLLGDQRVNRDVLKWVKQWDYCVFGKAPPSETQREKIMKSYKNTFGGNGASFQGNKTEKPKDRLLRPDRKIMLISGPPGFGKTTLAHVVANHANYNIVEVNASDDRTGDVVSSKIKSALEMQAIIREPVSTNDGTRTMSMDQKPNCLIIDEIDGASSGGGGESFIKQLVNLATAELKDDRNINVGLAKKKGKGKETAPLLRPIICICNDLYAPVLRPLRSVAHLIQFRKIPMLTIAKRLQEICEEEGLESDLRALSLLAEITDGDIRSCLNTLQFIRGKSSVFTREMLEEAGLGRKDMGKSLFSVWEEIFTAESGRKRAATHHQNHAPVDTKNRYLGRLTDSIMTNGEIEKIMQGCFESYPKMRYNDIGCQKIVHMSDWLNFYDLINHRTNDMHDYGLYGYLPYPAINFHRYFAGSASQERIEYPRVDYEQFVARKSYENLISVFLAGVNPKRRRTLHKDMIATELAPRLLRIMSPDIRPVNKQLIKPHEKEVLSRLIDVLIEFGITFLQEKNEDGQFVYKLDPPLEQIINFDGAGGVTGKVLPKHYAVRQLIAQEIELETIRRREQAARTREGALPRARAKPTIEEIVQKATEDKAPAKMATDFFGRVIQPDPNNNNSNPTNSRGPVV
ncbi:hypothetical protein BDB00DRAFT_792827 [Zychaea mexicana]|uniref:uncharacterized protein n=1 Tax=Zychaea mexicana TaxID=64656 RepID=UPI0022FF36FC|nr:uncharacterized protein BDB00DRAFT_792827 [Zychaea mexicana]KAI9484496.1 hypothetical protein BDB00DRAFT_792827 [Zychaea mexicana]